METTIPAVVETADKKRWLILGVTCFGLFMALLDVTIVNVALPSIGANLKASFSQLQWVVDAYTIPLAVLLVLAGRLGDIYGRKPWFTAGLVLFTLGSLNCGLSGLLSEGSSSGILILIGSRVLQGVGGAIMLPLSLAIISTNFQGKERGIAFGIFGGVSAFGTAIGPVLGGILVEKASWEWVFFVNIPFGILAVVACAFILPKRHEKPASRSVDLPGVATLCLTLLFLISALIRGQDAGWGSAEVLSYFAGSAILLAAFIIIELKRKNPMMDLRVFRNPIFTGANLVAFSLSASLYSIFLYLALYAQNYLGLSALNTGLIMLCVSIPTLIAAPLSGWLGSVIDKRIILTIGTGIVTLAIGLFLNASSLQVSSSINYLIPGLILAGFGSGLMNPIIAEIAMSGLPHRQAGMASGINNVFRQMGTAFGIAFLGAMLSVSFGQKLHGDFASLQLPNVSAAQNTAIVADIEKTVKDSGVFAASTGFRHPGPEYAQFAASPVFPQVQNSVADSFMSGFRTSVLVAAIIALLGFLSAGLMGLIRNQSGGAKGPDRAGADSAERTVRLPGDPHEAIDTET